MVWFYSGGADGEEAKYKVTGLFYCPWAWPHSSQPSWVLQDCHTLNPKPPVLVEAEYFPYAVASAAICILCVVCTVGRGRVRKVTAVLSPIGCAQWLLGSSGMENDTKPGLIGLEDTGWAWRRLGRWGAGSKSCSKNGSPGIGGDQLHPTLGRYATLTATEKRMLGKN